MKLDLEDYQPREPSVVGLAGHRLIAWVGDQTAAVGRALWVNGRATRIVKLLEGHRVEAVLLNPEGVEKGTAVRVGDEHLNWPPPRPGAFRLADLEFVAEERSSARSEQREPQPLFTGFEGIDEIAPLASYGTNLVFDASDGHTFERVLTAATKGPLVAVLPEDADGDAEYRLIYATDAEGKIAAEVATHWVMHLENPTLLVRSSLERPVIVDAGSTTTFLHLIAHEGLDLLAETLDVGHADAQLFIRRDGSLDLARSFSRVGDNAHSELFARASELKDRVALFGCDELDPEEQDLLDRVQTLEQL